MDCPWYISARAVRRYMALTGHFDFDDASDRLIEICAEVANDFRVKKKQPKLHESGALIYRAGNKYCNLRFIVSTVPRVEGPKPALVDVRR